MSALEVIVNISAEMPSYHDGQTTAFGAHLAFKADSKPSMLKLLGLEQWKFHAYRYDDAAKKVTKIDDSQIKVETISPNRGDVTAQRIVNWLESGRNVQFAKDESSTPGKAIDPSQATAAQILQSSVTWPSPLPHAAQMTHLLRLRLAGGAQLDDKVLLLPLAENEYSGVEVAGKIVTVPAKVGPSQDIEVVIKAILPLPSFDDPPEPIHKDNGFLKKYWSEQEFRFLSDLEAQAGSLVSTLPAMLTLPHEELLKCDKTNLCKLGCILAIDSLLFALISNGKSDREGALLSPLMSLVTQQNRKQVNEALRAKIKEVVDELSDATKLAYVLFAPSVGISPTNPYPLESEDKAKLTEDVKDLYLLLTNDPSVEDIHPEQVLSALNLLMSRLQSESGLEPAFLRMVSWAIARMGGDHKGLSDKYPEFISIVQGPYNAADAVRVDCGVLLAELIVKKKGAVTPTLWGVAKDLNLHASRLEAPNDLWKGLPDVSGLVDQPIKDQKAEQKKTWESLIARRLPEEQTDSRRFQPDKVPLPLPIPIATVPSGQKELNKLTGRFNGIALLIRREKSRDTQVPQTITWEDWAHANLVDLYTIWSDDLNNPKLTDSKHLFRRSIQPFLPVAVDGKREMFLAYNGTPLASPAYSQTMAPSVQSVDTTGRLPFFTTRDSNFANGTLAKPPRLAYGKQYEAIVYAVTKAGVLPKILQADSANTPWLPKTPDDPNDPPHGQVVEATYRRTTAIGSTTFGTPPGHPQRIGASYPDVYPLALDHARLNVTAFSEKNGVIDLFRNVDGMGQLPFPKKGQAVPTVIPSKPTLFDLEECTLFPKDASAHVKVAVEVHSSNNPDSLMKRMELSQQQIEMSEWRFAIIEHGDVKPPNTIVLELDDKSSAEHLWIRIRFESTIACNLSFSLPKHNLVAPLGLMPDAPPVLLVAPADQPADKKKWSTIFHSAKLSCSLSRTTWRDWDYWYSNLGLEMYGLDRSLPGISDNVDKALLTASVMRGVDTDIATLCDRLPDPAVSGYLIELAGVDTIGDTIPRPDPVHKVVLYETGQVKDAFTNPPAESLGDKDYREKLKAFLRQIDTAFNRQVNILCEASLKIQVVSNVTNICVPPGVVAQLTVRPLVKKSVIGSTIDGRMAQLACAEIADYLVFEGASLTIEGMYDAEWSKNEKDPQARRKNPDPMYAAMLNTHVAVRTTSTAREYRIVETGIGMLTDDLWKCFSHMDIRTQRWRFSGRPIYSWISPKDHKAQPTDPSEPCLELKRHDPPGDSPLRPDEPFKADVDLKTFEGELFFDRDAADAEVTRVRLSGQMATDSPEPLQAFAWELPSATYFRHGFQLISRYAGALKLGGGGSPVWPPETIPWVRRVAVLADATRLEITRPQVRCLVPLSSTPTLPDPSKPEPVFQGAADPQKTPKAPSPPVACILEEKPFAVGGLADRILAEIKTGIGYGFLDGNQKTVLPLDFGKETSRDGRIASWSWMPHIGENLSDPTKSFVLNAEGPIGLHFERSSTIAPTWVNCEYLLQPRSLEDGHDGALPEESFVAVQLRRILAPDWVAKRPDAVVDDMTKAIDVFQSAVGTFALDAFSSGQAGYLMKLTSAIDDPVLQYKVTTNKEIEVLLARKWIANTDTPNQSLTLCRVPLSKSGRLAIVHSQVADGLFHATVCVIPNKASVKDGTIKSYTPIASVVWSRPTGITATKLAFPTATDLSVVSASSQTTREWTRTAKNSDYVATLDQHSLGEPKHVLMLRSEVKQGRLTVTSADSSDPVWVTTEAAESRMPQYVQRHLVAVLTKRSKSLGRQVDLFCKACLVYGKEPELPLTDGAEISDLRLHELEVPASIVAYGESDSFKPGGPLQRFQEARIDIVSTGGNDGARRFRFHCRIANSYESIAGLKSLKVTLGLDFIENDKPNTTDVVLSIPGGKGLRAFTLLFSTGDKNVVYERHLWDGTIDEQTVKLSVAVPKDVRAIRFKIDSAEFDPMPQKPNELWADLSVLHSESSHKDDEFDFGWLFSSMSADASQAATRTLPIELANRTEAQARLISFGEPMLLRKN